MGDPCHRSAAGRARRAALPLGLALLALAGCRTGSAPSERAGGGSGGGPGGGPSSPPVEGYVVSPRALERTLSVSGTLKPFEEVTLMPETAGRVVALHLPEGEVVRQGTLLVKLFDADLQAQLTRSRAELAIAEQGLTRQTELFGVNGVSQSEVDAAALQVNSARAEVEVLKAQIGKTQILAPFDGVVGLRQVSVGAGVTPSTVVASFRSVSRLKLDFSVPERYATQVHEGLVVSFTTQDGGPPRSATVTATEAGVDVSTRSLDVRAEVDGDPEGLLPGTYASVTLALAGNPQALLVPTQAVVPQESGSAVILSRQGKATLVSVRTGVRRAADIEVTEGLAPGDTVVTTGVQLLRQGAELRFSRIRLASEAAP